MNLRYADASIMNWFHKHFLQQAHCNHGRNVKSLRMTSNEQKGMNNTTDFKLCVKYLTLVCQVLKNITVYL